MRLEGAVAWVSAECTLSTAIRGEEHAAPGRMTAVLKRQDDRWQLARATSHSRKRSERASGGCVDLKSRCLGVV